MTAAFITFAQEQVAAALLRRDGTIRERGSRAITIDIARPSASTDADQCYNCFQTGHFARECVSAPACRRCRQTGHAAADCRETPAASSNRRRVCGRCGDPTHHAGACHWSNETIRENSEQHIGVATLSRWGTGNAEAAGGPPGRPGGPPDTPASRVGGQAATWATPSTQGVGGQVTPATTPELTTLTKRLNDLETRSALNHSNVLAAISAQQDLVDTGFDEVRRNQATAVAGLHSALTRNITSAIATASQHQEASMRTMMAMISQMTGMQVPTLPTSARPQIGNGVQPQPSNGAGTQQLLGNGNTEAAGQLPQITLDGHNFAGTQQIQAAPQESESYREAQSRAREAIQQATSRRTGAPDIIDAQTNPAANAAERGPSGTPQ